MRRLILIVFGFLSINCFGQNFKKILSKSELDSLNNSLKIYKIIDKSNCKDFCGSCGKIKIEKKGKNIKWNFDGLASKYNDNNRLISQCNYDSTGNFLTYQVFDENQKIIYNRTYEYKTIKGCSYRLEHVIFYYEQNPNLIFQDGWSFIKLKNKKGKKCRFSFSHDYGKWKNYNQDGTIKEIWDYGEIQ